MIFKVSNTLRVGSGNIFVKPVSAVQRCDHSFFCCAYRLLSLVKEKLVNSKVRRAEAWKFNDFKVSCNETRLFSSYNKKCSNICVANLVIITSTCLCVLLDNKGSVDVPCPQFCFCSV